MFMCVCLRGCVSAYFSPHMGVIWSFVIPCLHTHTLLVLLHFVVFLFVWTKCSLARANTWSVFFFFLFCFFFFFFAVLLSCGVFSFLSVLFGFLRPGPVIRRIILSIRPVWSCHFGKLSQI